MPGGARSLLTVSVCCLAGAVRGSACSPMQVATTSRRLNVAAPSPFCLSSYICTPFHGSMLHTSILIAGGVHFYISRCIFLCLRLIPWMFSMVWYLSSSIQVTS